MSLKNNYTNDVLNSSMNGRRRYNMITNADGTVSFEDVTVYDSQGDTFGAVDANLPGNSTLDSLDEIDANSNSDMICGALAAKEISSGLKGRTQTLSAGSTSVTFTDASITENSTFDFYADVYGVQATDVSVVNGSVTLTFDAQETDVIVKARWF